MSIRGSTAGTWNLKLTTTKTISINHFTSGKGGSVIFGHALTLGDRDLPMPEHSPNVPTGSTFAKYGVPVAVGVAMNSFNGHTTVSSKLQNVYEWTKTG